MPKESKPCLCECGTVTKGGDFAPGHDARFKSMLIQQVIDGGPQAAAAKAAIKARGWGKFLAAKVESIKAKEIRSKERVKSKAAAVKAKAAKAKIAQDENAADGQAA